uniref:Uncharacterized protein n=2 Tax=Anguilla anguilla TaxID=7936 RepID=A0A0E9VR85_ANGAN
MNVKLLKLNIKVEVVSFKARIQIRKIGYRGSWESFYIRKFFSTF